MIKIIKITDRIPLRAGLAYGIAFVVTGLSISESIAVTVVQRTSYPCVLRSTGAVVYQNDTLLNVRIGVPRHVGARIVAGEDSPCVDPPGPGIETIEIYYEGKSMRNSDFPSCPMTNANRNTHPLRANRLHARKPGLQG